MKITAEYQAQRRKKFFAAGLCECGSPLEGNYKSCDECRRIKRLKWEATGARKTNRRRGEIYAAILSKSGPFTAKDLVRDGLNPRNAYGLVADGRLRVVVPGKRGNGGQPPTFTVA